MATESRTTGLTYEDLQGLPDDNLRREIIDGELFVTPSPVRRHQHVVVALSFRLVQYARDHGGPANVYVAPMDVYFAQSNVVEPDVLYLTGETATTLVDPRYVDVPPDLVVEVSSPGTRITDLTRKKDLYARFGVREYWFVDLESDRIDVYRLEDGRYDRPSAFVRSDTLTSPVLPGLSLSVDEILGPRED